MKLIPLLLVVSAIAALAPSVEAQDSLNRGKGSDKQSDSDRGRNRPSSSPSARPSRGNDQPVTRGNDRSANPVNRGGDGVGHGRDSSPTNRGRNSGDSPRTRDRGNGSPAYPIINERSQDRGSTGQNDRGLFNYRAPQDPLNRGKGNGGGNGGGGGQRSNDPQQRPSNPQPQRSQDDGDRSPQWTGPSQSPLSRAPQTRSRDSRSGVVHYGGSNNQAADNRSSRVVAPSIPNDARVARGSLRQPSARVRDDRYRDDRWRDDRWRDDRSWRSGYWQYNRDWRDDYFRYPHYRFNYNVGYCPSPWYGYVNLPAYIDPTRCLNTVSINFGWGLGIRYTWSSYNDYSRRSYRSYDRYYSQPVGYGDLDLDYAVSGIQNGFRNRDMAQFDSLLPRNESVYVDLGDRPGYSLRTDDFYDMLNDVVQATNTQSYSIVEVYNNGREATVIADHRFTDAWGGTVTQRHWFGLTRDRYGYRIISFRTSARY